MKMGFCLPDSCSNNQISRGLTKNLCQNANAFVAFKVNNAVTIDGIQTPDYDAKDKIMLSFFVFICIMLICGTALESWQHYRQRHGVQFENGPLENWVLSFGLYNNTSKLMNTDIPKKADHLGCIDGIRFLSMTWVVLCHCWGEGQSLPMKDTNLGLLKVSAKLTTFFQPPKNHHLFRLPVIQF